MVTKCKEDSIEPELRPEYIKKILSIKKRKGIHFKSVDDLRKRLEIA